MAPLKKIKKARGVQIVRSDLINDIGEIYRKLKNAWSTYIAYPNLKDQFPFPPDEISHDFFNMTDHIYQNMDFFLLLFCYF